MKKPANTSLIIVSAVLGIILIVAFAVFVKSGKIGQETITLPIKFEEFADFECPACGYYSQYIDEVVKSYSSDNVVYQFRHFPLSSIHKYAYQASLATEAAREQGKFNEYSSLLFKLNIQENLKTENTQVYLSDVQLIQYAQDLGLNVDKFKTDIKSDIVKARVEADVNEANSRGINGTPSFYISGRKFNLQQSAEIKTGDPEAVRNDVIRQFKAAIDERIKQAK